MPETSRDLFDTADLAFKRGQWAEALAAFGGVVKAQPAHFRSRFRIADCLLNLGRRELALDVYKAIAWYAIKTGYPLLGLVAVKMILLLDPGFEDILVILSELYSEQSDRIGTAADAPEYPTLGDDAAEALSETDEALITEAAQIGQAMPDENFPERLPPIPLFSHLEEDSFIAILGKLRLRRYADDELIVRQGERGEPFFIIADGDVLIKRDIEEDGGVTLAHLHRGAVFGEMALVSDEPRHASVVARGDVDVLEMRRSELVVAAAHLDGVTAALKLFTRERFLGNLTATHPLFTALSRAERHKMMDLFVPVNCAAGDELIAEGQPGPGLFLLLGGAAEVSKMAQDERVYLATLKAGDLCGEMSLVGDAPTNASVIAQEPVEALFLSREKFLETVREHPQIMKYLAGLSDERVRQNRAVLQQKGLLEDDEHIMV